MPFQSGQGEGQVAVGTGADLILFPVPSGVHLASAKESGRLQVVAQPRAEAILLDLQMVLNLCLLLIEVTGQLMARRRKEGLRQTCKRCVYNNVFDQFDNMVYLMLVYVLRCESLHAAPAWHCVL